MGFAMFSQKTNILSVLCKVCNSKTGPYRGTVLYGGESVWEYLRSEFFGGYE